MTAKIKAGTPPVEPPALPVVSQFRIFHGDDPSDVELLLRFSDRSASAMVRPNREQAAGMVELIRQGEYRVILRNESGALRIVTFAPAVAPRLADALAGVQREVEGLI